MHHVIVIADLIIHFRWHLHIINVDTAVMCCKPTSLYFAVLVVSCSVAHVNVGSETMTIKVKL